MVTTMLRFLAAIFLASTVHAATLTTASGTLATGVGAPGVSTTDVDTGTNHSSIYITVTAGTFDIQMSTDGTNFAIVTSSGTAADALTGLVAPRSVLILEPIGRFRVNWTTCAA